MIKLITNTFILLILFTFVSCNGGGESSVDNFLGFDETTDNTDEETNTTAAISYSSSTFFEAGANDGSIDTTVIITVTNAEFSGATSSDFLADGKVTVNNLPAGLTAEILKTSATTLSATLTGNATAHSSADSISSLKFAFLDTAFDADVMATDVVGSTKPDLRISYSNPGIIIYGGTTFTESSSNNGAISTTIVATVSGDSFAGANGTDFIVSGQALPQNVPTGLTMTATKTSGNQVVIALTGNAGAHISTDSISNLGILFQNTAFIGNDAAAVTDASKTNFIVNFLDAINLSYSTTSFSEAEANIGTMGNTASIVLFGNSLAGTVGEDFIATGKALVSNVPGGLAATLVKVNSTNLTLSLTGSASAHANANDISNLTVSFQDSAFTSALAADVTNAVVNNIVVDFDDPYLMLYDLSTFNESITNNGSISTTVTTTLIGTTLSGTNGENYVGSGKAVITGTPGGLTPVVTRINSQQLQYTFTGTAAAHADANDVASALEIALQDSAFTSGSAAGINNSTKSDFSIDFIDTPSMAWSTTTFVEASANIGNITTSIVLTLSNDTYNAASGENLVATGKLVLTNIPAGLTAEATVISTTQTLLTLDGNATVHENSNDVTNIVATFQDSAFTNSNAAEVGTYQNTLSVDYQDAFTLSYSAVGFEENTGTNNGSMASALTLTLSGVSFTGSNSDDFLNDGKATLTNLPGGLSASLVRNSTTQLTFTLSGNATSHDYDDSINNMSLIFDNAAFSSGLAAGVRGSTRTDLSVKFFDDAGGVLTLREGLNGYSGAQDTWIQANNVSATHGGDNYARIRHNHSSTTERFAGLFQWILPNGQIPSSAEITKVTLTLTKESDGGSGNDPCLYEIRILNTDWAEDTAAWERPMTGQNWNVDGAQGSDIGESVGTIYVGMVDGDSFSTDFNKTGIAHVQSWLTDSSQNKGFRIAADQVLFGSCGIDVYSSDEGTATRRPTLEITYRTPTDGTMGWTAFHDVHPSFSGTVSNITRGYNNYNPVITPLTTGDGITGTSSSEYLQDFSNGLNVDALINFDIRATNSDTSGAIATSGDASTLFGSNIDTSGAHLYANTGADYLDIILSGLSTNRTYDMAAFTNLGSGADRITRFELRNATSFTQASSSGVTLSTTTLANDTVSYDANNSTDGYLAHFRDIIPSGSGGTSFNLYVSEDAASTNPAIFPSSLMVKENSLNFQTDAANDAANVTEGATTDIRVRLTRQPPSSVSVTAAFAPTNARFNRQRDTSLSVSSGSSLTFTTANWNIYQTITVAAAEDDGDQDFSNELIISASGAPNKVVTVTEVDNDTANLIFHLNFEGNVNDVSGAGNNGSLQGGAAIVAEGGSRGSVLQISADGDHVRVPRAAMGTVSDEMTIMCWVYRDGTPDRGHIMGKERYGHDWGLRYDTGSGGRIEWRVNKGGNQSFNTAGGLIPATTWTHIAATVSDEELYVYINGVVNDTVGDVNPPDSNIADNAARNIWIGDANGQPEFRGKLDDCKIYDRALDQTTIQSIYNSEL